MKVKDVMTDDVKCCSMDTNLAAAAKIMWEGDCGAVPVTDGQNKVIGMITDRDICIAAATRPRPEGEIPVEDVISRTLHACSPNDNVHVALATMKAQQIRRLPVVGHDGRLAGVISLRDIAVLARTGRGVAAQPEDVLDAFIAITAPSPTRMATSA